MVRSGSVEVSTFSPYHSGKGRNSSAARCAPEDREFIAWDGEGMTFSGAHRYVLFGNSTGDRITIQDSDPFGLGYSEILDFIVDQGIANPGAWHVGFAFNYDSNMIIRSLPAHVLWKLHKSAMGYVRYQQYGITFRPGKWLQVTRYHSNWDREHNSTACDTTRIFDMFGFFTCSFVKAVEDLLGSDYPHLEAVKAGKGARAEFSLKEWNFMEEYWEYEIDMLAALADELRDRLYSAGLRITQWHGPGALASYAMGKNGIKNHMDTCPKEVREAARYAYAGGRFELFKVGRIEGPIYGIDINSAYPSYIAQLPSLTAGRWRHVVNPPIDKIQKFAVYRVSLHASAGFDVRPGPFFHRDSDGNVSFPWVNETWVWAPEVHHFRTRPGNSFRILEGWEYVGYGDTDFPFDWVREMYATRRAWKDSGNPSELALKLCMNSLYGKMAQRVGWDEERDRVPPWHQLEWAGWVTSYTRAQLYSVMREIPQEHLIGVETDGIYTTMDPENLGITSSKQLGEWEVKEYDELLYVQSGLCFLRSGPEWEPKYRGLDRDSFPVGEAREYLGSLRPDNRWDPFVGQTTRFVGLGAALARSGSVHDSHCRWETTPRAISPGETGKRIHFPGKCRACELGLDAYEMAHDLVIRSKSMAGEMSSQHYVPWENGDQLPPAWEEEQEMQHALIRME